MAAGLIGWHTGRSALGCRSGYSRWSNAALGAGLAVAARAALGLRGPSLWAGLRPLGLAVAAPVIIGVGASTGASPVRSAMADRAVPAAPASWLGVSDSGRNRVVGGRQRSAAALGTVAADAFGPTGGRLLQALAFGLSHIDDARGAKEPVIGTVVVTGVAGWFFALLREHSGSLAAPMLAHLAIDEAGAVAAIAVQRLAR